MRLRLALLFTVALPAGPILAQQVPSIARTPVDTLASERVVGPVGIRLDQLLRRYEAYGFSGAALVSLNDSIVLLRGYGFADRERDIRNSPATRFEINSITKSFTAAAILQLEERGLLHTADPVTRYLGRFRPEKASATIDHLATHTAGLVADGSPLDGSTRASFVESVKHAAIEARPGRTYRYTNAAYSMMAAIVETVSGQSYEEYARDHLFRPAGLLATTFRGLTSADDPLFARGYVGTPGSPRPAGPEPYQWGRVGADGMVSTVGDLFRWLGAIQAGRIMAEPARHKMFTAQPRGREGFGWHVARTAWGSTVIEKGGGSAEFASEILYFPDDRLVVIWICNDLRQRWRRALNTTIPAAALGREFLMPPPVARARTDVAPLAGAYDAEAGAVYLRAGDGYLYTRRNPAAVPDDVPFLPVTRMSFSAFDPSAMETMTLRFQRTPGGTLRAEFRRGRRAVILQKRGP